MTKEQNPREQQQNPRHHPELPDELVEAIASEEYACVTAPTDEGTIFVVKAPGAEITRLSGIMPVEVRHELYAAATAPVIRTLLILYDDPHAPFALETYINIGDPNQRQDFAQLAEQESVVMRFYDEDLHRRLDKRVTLSESRNIAAVLAQAEQLRQRIPEGGYDFDLAKSDVLAIAPWPPPRGGDRDDQT
jgi:hypothetical protein